MRLKLLYCCILFIISTALVLHLQGEIGKTGISSLMIDSYGARASALGDAFVGISDDINTISVNPAGLNTLDSVESTIMYLKYPLDISFGYLAIGTKLPRNIYNGYFASSLAFFYLPDFDQYDSSGNKINKKLSADDFVLTVGYANNPLKLFKIKQNLNIGINFKYIQSRLIEDRRSTFGIDIGALYKMNFINWGEKKLKDNLGIGMSIQNIGPPIKYIKNNTTLPVNFRIGIGYNGYKDPKNNILMGFDVNIPNDSNIIISIGIEYSFIKMIFVRMGYKLQGRETEDISFGIGGKYTLSEKILGFDYSLIPLKDLGTKHTFSLNIKFGREGLKKITEKDIIIKEKENELLININKKKMFDFDKYEITEEGYKILNKVVSIIKKEDYKRILITIQTEDIDDKEYDLNSSESLIKEVYKYIIEKGIDQKRIEYKGYRKVKLIGDEKVKILGFKVLIIRWKEGEEEKFKYHYFSGLDAFIKEGYNIAIEEWKEALKIDPENKNIKRRIKEATEELKKKNENEIK